MHHSNRQSNSSYVNNIYSPINGITHEEHVNLLKAQCHVEQKLFTEKKIDDQNALSFSLLHMVKEAI